MSHRRISRIQPVLIGELRPVSYEMDRQETGPNDTMVVNAQFWLQFHEQFWSYENPSPSSHDAEAAEAPARRWGTPVHPEPLS